MKKLISPRGYLSWTQVNMWEHSKARYIRNYMLGEDDNFGNALMDYGKKTADALESGLETGDELLDLVVSILPKYSVMEHEIKVPLETPAGETVLLGKLDTFDPPELRFREYKTGRTKWTQRKAQNHKQLHHYQTLIWLQHKKIVEKVHLDWAETERTEDGGVCFTGNIQTFTVAIGMREVLEYINLVSRVAREIDAEYRKQMQNLT